MPVHHSSAMGNLRITQSPKLQVSGLKIKIEPTTLNSCYRLVVQRFSCNSRYMDTRHPNRTTTSSFTLNYSHHGPPHHPCAVLNTWTTAETFLPESTRSHSQASHVTDASEGDAKITGDNNPKWWIKNRCSCTQLSAKRPRALDQHVERSSWWRNRGEQWTQPDTVIRWRWLPH